MMKMQLDKLLWLDLEMTGLRPDTDVILEVACIVTDLNFKELGHHESVIKPRHDVLPLMDETVRTMHKDNGLLNRLTTGIDEQQARNELSAFIRQHFATEKAVMAGNSIHMDRRFIEAQWPEIAQLLHYRMLDVSSYKILAQAKYGLLYEKQEAHRALDDIRESIAELQFYEAQFGVRAQ